MDLWKELTDTSMYDKRIPCVLCTKDSEKTVVGEHWKCSECSHLFNQDGSPLNVECYCEKCSPREQSGSIEDKGKGKSKKIINKIKETFKKIVKKVKHKG